MQRFATCATYGALVTTALVLLPAAPSVAIRPDIERASYVDRFQDDFIHDLCGIETWTTVTERWSSKTFADGSETFHVVRTFVPDDPRIPIEKGAATSFFAADGSRTVVGTPIHLKRRDEGTFLIDAGRALFDAEGNLISVHGPHPSLDADLAEYYCPDSDGGARK
jgi:hypothetical protein